ncbi:zinc finger protein SNAI2-like isoform X2 [Culicoides brevitarsis]|uniref:zinc finger protein SNAI2-like isoform X2 n=1 Tax=Culicoides brevitarsis TaxID=469753 RepID=UPI00307B510D
MCDDYDIESLKNIELDKICRLCLSKRKSMRPLFGELIVDMLMEITQVKVENIDGWPNQVCLQCIHQISRFHAFKTRVEKLDAHLREYIKGLTVIVEETQLEIPRDITTSKAVNRQDGIQHISTPQMIVNTAQVLNNNQNTQFISPAGQILQGHIIQGPENTVQMITSPSVSTQLLQLRSTSDRCELIVQPPDMVSMVMQTQENASEVSPEIDMDENIEDVEDADENEEIESENEEKQLLAEFMANQTTTKDNLHICNLCQNSFKHVKWLQSHMKSHSNWMKANCKKLPECKICFKSFRGEGMLKMHMKVHAEKINSCTICKKEFKSKSILYRHRQTHFEKQFSCTSCEKSFSTNYQLKNHLARHRGEKTFKCSQCDKAYYNSSDLKNHIQSHLNVITT